MRWAKLRSVHTWPTESVFPENNIFSSFHVDMSQSPGGSGGSPELPLNVGSKLSEFQTTASSVCGAMTDPDPVDFRFF